MIAERDVIAELAGIEPGSHLEAVRARRAQARDNAEGSYRALFEPVSPGDLSLVERFAVATFVAGLHSRPRVQAHYAAALSAIASPGLLEAIATESEMGATSGPYGSYPPGPLGKESRAGLVYRVSSAHRTVLGARLGAALEHAHLLVFRPRDAAPDALTALLAAGFSATAIVTLSQLVAFLAFQIRAVAGFEALAAAEADR